MSNTKNLGGLREKVRKGEMTPDEALKALKQAEEEGYVVYRSIRNWLVNRKRRAL